MNRGGAQRIVGIACLVIAGEAIFSLPFHVARYFRPTLLLALDLTNTQLGLIQAAYGVVAMLAYFPGGFLADLFSTRVLLTASLATTALGGFYFASFPGYEGLWLLFGFWGLTTILLFWAALIRATREWGARDAQGYAYGILDGGRGLFAAVMFYLARFLERAADFARFLTAYNWSRVYAFALLLPVEASIGFRITPAWADNMLLLATAVFVLIYQGSVAGRALGVFWFHAGLIALFDWVLILLTERLLVNLVVGVQ